MELRKPKNITIFDVAKASGVSYSTVSRVLSGFAFVKESTRLKVLGAAQELGYVANVQARSLAGGKSRVVGLLVPNLVNSYISEVARGIDEALVQVGYDLMLYTTHHEKDKEARYAKALSNGLSDGLLLLVPLISSSYLTRLRQQNFPYVLIDQVDITGESSSIDASNWQGAYAISEYLLSLGHRRIGFIAGRREVNSASDRLAGFKAALADHGISIDSSLIVEGLFDIEKSRSATADLLKQRPLVTAIFAANDLSAFGAMEAIRAAGLGIPEDISVVGFDDIPQASITYPKLTTVRQPLAQMGELAVKLLLEHIDKPDKAAQKLTLATELIIRDSCRAI